MRTPLWVRAQAWLPQRTLARIVYRASRSRRPWLRSMLIGRFARGFDIDMSEAARPGLSDYESLQDFFTRELRAGARPIDSAARSLVSPADGKLSDFGRLEDGRIIHAKGLEYELSALVGESGDDVAAFASGSFATIYLAPHNYHRFHMPLGGRLVRCRYIPGTRFAVNEPTLRHYGMVFCRNERVCCWFDTPHGRLVVVLVGALNVSSVSLAWRGEIESGLPRSWTEPEPVVLDKGQELGSFNLGSTIVLACENGGLAWDPALGVGDSVRVGRALGHFGPPEQAETSGHSLQSGHSTKAAPPGPSGWGLQ